MRKNYKKLGPYIQVVNVRNTDLAVDRLLGVSIQKILIPSIANTVGTNMSKYKVVKKGQFAYGPVTSRNGDKISIALLEDYPSAIISQSYKVFEVTNENELLPEYLMMWFRRPEFDRYARFMSHGSTRETFDWDELCEVEVPIPSIEKQREIVKEYNTVVNRIKLNEQLNQKLEETAQALYKNWFESDQKGDWDEIKLEEVCNLITDGKHGNCQDEVDSGYYFISVKDISNSNIYYSEARQITKSDFEETHRRTNLEKGDVLMTNAGTIGRLAIAKDLPETRKTTFQKSVAIIKPNKDFISSYFLYSMLRFNIKEIKELAGGSTQSNLLLGDLKSFQFFYPGFENVKRFEQKVTPVFLNLELKWRENLALEQMKDLLLSKMTRVEEEKTEIV